MSSMQEDSSHSTKRVAALFAIGGLLVGALAVALFMRFGGASQPNEEPIPVASLRVDGLKGRVQPVPTVEAPPTEITAPETAEGSAAPDAAQPVPPTQAPSLPPPTELRGSVPNGSSPSPVGTRPFQPPTPDAALRTSEVPFVRLNVYTAAGESARAEVEAYVHSLRAESRAFTDFGSEGEPTEGLLVLISDQHVDATVKFVQARNSNVVEQSWKISPQLRQIRLEDETHAALFNLKAKRQKLLVKYLDDADPVRVVEESITKAEAALRRLKIKEADLPLAAIKLTFGPRG